MKAVFYIEYAFLINNNTVKNKICLSGVPIADFDIADVKRLFVNNQNIDVLDFNTSVAIWGGVNLFYLIDNVAELEFFNNCIAFVDDDKFYGDLTEKATTENLTYFINKTKSNHNHSKDIK